MLCAVQTDDDFSATFEFTSSLVQNDLVKITVIYYKLSLGNILNIISTTVSFIKLLVKFVVVDRDLAEYYFSISRKKILLNNLTIFTDNP